jgi:4-alpha-glucanotransferase
VAHTSEPAGHTISRAAGVLLHPTSLPGRYGVGDLGDELIVFLDWVASAGMRVWQVLPLNPPGYGFSPYGCLSSYAGNYLLISPQRLLQDGLLPEHAIDTVPEFPDTTVEFDRVKEFKTKLLRQSLQYFNENARPDQRAALRIFERDNAWLHDWALYVAIKHQQGGRGWSAWPHGLAVRDRDALAQVARDLAEEIQFRKYVQWLFFSQWAAVREAAKARGIDIMGDIPIYVAWDSADVWANRELFQLDEDGNPTVVAGVPPDYFSSTGQRWGNPLYRWDVIREKNYRWWVSRIRANLRFADIIRLDHFRGFASYWEIPAAEPTAIHGRWMPGPGKALFDAIRGAVGDIKLVAEDLGFITAEVHELRHAVNVPGMKILQFGFSHVDSPHLPHRYDSHTVVYTGTHDNDTANGWFENAPENERELAREYLGCEAGNVAWGLTRCAYTSVAEMAIVPVQDILGLGSVARMNRPGDSIGNWSWRMLPGSLKCEEAERLHKLAEITGRL